MKKYFLAALFIISLGLVACREPETAATPAAILSPTAEPVPTETIPPVQSPTIVIPVASDTPQPAATETATEIPALTETAVATERPAATPVASPAPPVEISAKTSFAAYKLPELDTVAAIYHEPIAPDLGNVTMPFVLSEAQRVRLAQDGFVVSPGVEKEFFTVYEQARYDNVPAFVTSDSLLHVYHLLFDKVLRTAETEAFVPMLQSLNEAMLAQTAAQYEALQGSGSEWEEAARRTVAFIGVGSRLLDPDVAVPDYAADLVEAELALIEDAAGINPSPLFPGLAFGEDYTQYIPRGHYTRSEALTAYFKSMMWYGRMTFRLKTMDPDVGRAETRAALLLVYALRTADVNGRPAIDVWLDLYNPTAFLVGRSDDLTAMQYLQVIDQVYGTTPSLGDIADEARLNPFIDAADELPPPRILGLVIAATDDEEVTTKGFRFMGQRFVPDAYIFRQLIFRNVGTGENPRMLPKGLDVMAALGSQRAYAILDEMGETEYQNYPAQMARMQEWVAGLSTAEWTETLYTTWLYTFYPLLEAPGDGYPQFMQSEAWLDKQLNTALGSWAELKHDTILYAKQVYAEMGGGSGAPLPKPAEGYVEPVPEFFARLSALTVMTREGMGERGLLSEQDANSLLRLETLSNALQQIAEKELRGEPLDEGEYRLIRFYGGELEHLTMAAADSDGTEGTPVLDEDPQAAVIADVATAPDPDGDGIPDPAVLEEAVGRINEIYVVVPSVDETGELYLQVAKGGVFAYYEFTWPADDRLTDEKWRQMLEEGEAPPLPQWTSSFITAETEDAQIQRVIYGFETGLSMAYWETDVTYALYRVTDEVKAQFTAILEELRAAGHYIGRQWLNADYRSFDRQAEDLVVVTVRETWDDTLYDLGGQEWPDGSNPIGHRGPFTLDVTYTLQRVTEGEGESARDTWRITRVVYANEPPLWQQE